MKTAKQHTTKNDKSNAERAIEKLVENALTVADVARELNLNEKRARAYLRKHPNEYAPFRNKTFTKTSSLYTKCRDLLAAYAAKRAPVTE